MGQWKNLLLLSMVAASVLGLPRPDEYQIPVVGNNRRSQYYVLHDDGSFKYGYDTGDNAFESQKTYSDGDVDGKFGYTDSDGQEFNIQYTSGTGGFVARGSHIPQVHPDVAAVFAARRSDKPFVDPLADSDGDRSYNFDFDGEEHSRSEVSDSDGTVKGSYSYIDEFGRTKTYTYRAGKGIGFVIEGDDIPQQVQHLPAHNAAVAAHKSHFDAAQARRVGSSNRATSHRAQALKSHGQTFATNKRQRVSGQRTSHQRTVQKPAPTYFPPTSSTNTRSSHSANTRHSTLTVPSTSHTGHSSNRRQQTFAQRQTVSRPQTSSLGTRQFEAANTRTSLSPSGSYSLAYETSSHSRQEDGDDDNNVRGQFSFRADDDGEDRSVNYEASSATGFIAEGKHLPIGPIVPGAPTGQVTGRIVPVEEIEFVDPLADGDLDASFDFGFESDTYSRSETADEDGNVVGTYSVLGEDNIMRTYRYRAGKGIGFETTEISAVPSRNRATSSSSSSFGHGSSTRSGASSSTHTSVKSPSVISYTAPKASGHASRAQSSFASNTRSSSSGAHRSSHKIGGASTFSSNTRKASTFHKFGGAVHGTRSDSNEVFPGFTLRQYEPSEGRGKFGYVLKFDN